MLRELIIPVNKTEYKVVGMRTLRDLYIELHEI
jgi:hypothetical protein